MKDTGFLPMVIPQIKEPEPMSFFEFIEEHFNMPGFTKEQLEHAERLFDDLERKILR